MSNTQANNIRNLKERQASLAEALEECFTNDLFEEYMQVESELAEELALV